jgi:hypothetical protein
MRILVSEVVFREDLYPRIKTSPETVQRYAEDLSILPPIEVNQHKELIDGWHRWTAHKKNEEAEIEVKITETKSDAEFLELAITRNASHGLQLSREDKRKFALAMYSSTTPKERGAKKKEIARVFSVSERTLTSWFSDIEQAEREERNQRIFDAWLSCHTQEEIAAAEEMPQQTVADKVKDFTDFGKLSKFGKTSSEYADDFTPQVYNVWRKQEKTNAVSHFGNTEQLWLDNLLYRFTKPFDIVVDPFAGGGSTIDVCKKRLRRYFVSDRLPIVEREKEIRKHDVTAGLPEIPRWQDVKLVYLDPPYWRQAAGQYSDDADDLANMPLEQFNETLSNLIVNFGRKLTDAHIALIIQPTQWKSDNREFVDHVYDAMRLVDAKRGKTQMKVTARISAPYSTEQYTPQMVNWAKEHKEWLVLTREIIVWSVGDAASQ